MIEGCPCGGEKFNSEKQFHYPDEDTIFWTDIDGRGVVAFAGEIDYSIERNPRASCVLDSEQRTPRRRFCRMSCSLCQREVGYRTILPTISASEELNIA